jgi:hypothetical protein
VNGVALMRFLTRSRIGFHPSRIDHGPGPRAQSRCTRWWWVRQERTGGAGPDIRVIVDYQHTVHFGRPYWSAYVRCGRQGFEWRNGPELVSRRRRG